MIYEMRVYRCLPGRLPALLKRFETITLKLWEKHGIKQAGFFTTLVGESNQELTYLLAWESLADREKKWAAFQAIRTGSRRARRPKRTARSSATSSISCWCRPVLVGEVTGIASRHRPHRARRPRPRRGRRLYRRAGFTVGARNRHRLGHA